MRKPPSLKETYPKLGYLGNHKIVSHHSGSKLPSYCRKTHKRLIEDSCVFPPWQYLCLSSPAQLSRVPMWAPFAQSPAFAILPLGLNWCAVDKPFSSSPTAARFPSVASRPEPHSAQPVHWSEQTRNPTSCFSTVKGTDPILAAPMKQPVAATPCHCTWWAVKARPDTRGQAARRHHPIHPCRKRSEKAMLFPARPQRTAVSPQQVIVGPRSG